jgi:hypothetical protein
MDDVYQNQRHVMDSKWYLDFLIEKIILNLFYSNDCHDNSDEKPSLCQAEQCPPGQFQCRNKQCIPYEVVCNGVRNCTDGSDEPSSCG